MNRIFLFLKTFNRHKYLIIGFIVGLFALGALPALYSATVAGTCLGLKDKLHGCYWDWLDWILSVSGGGAAAILWLLI